jgi:hypothetical protein
VGNAVFTDEHRNDGVSTDGHSFLDQVAAWAGRDGTSKLTIWDLWSWFCAKECDHFPGSLKEYQKLQREQ